MRITKVIFAGFAAVLLTTAPAWAKRAETQKTDEQSSPSSCHAYRQAADGTWEQLPCQEAGGGETQHRPAAKASEEAPR
jgi:hypothetical protein